MKTAVKIETIKVSEIVPNENNPRIIKEDKFERLVESIKTFPEMLHVRPLVIDENNVVLGGNMRLKACIEAGLKDLPVIRCTNWSEERKTEFIIKDNVGFGEWDWNILANEWDVHPLVDWGLDVWETEPEEVEGLTDEDAVPEAPQETITKLGDVWILGEHRVMCGDSTSKEAVEILMDGDNAELLFTSPPYSDMREYNGGKNLDINNLVSFIPQFAKYAKYQCINLGIKRHEHNIISYWDDYISAAKDVGYDFLSWNVWAKTNAGSVGNQSAFIPISHEWIFVFGYGFKNINRTEERKTKIKKDRTSRKVRQADGSMKSSSVGIQEELKEMESVYYSAPELGNIRKDHPATFPIELPSKYIKAITDKYEIIVDPFLGSGSTLIAAEKTKRKCYGMELDAKYCDVIVKRWEDFTGKKATREIDDLEVMTQAH